MRHLGQERHVPPDTSGPASLQLAHLPGSPPPARNIERRNRLLDPLIGDRYRLRPRLSSGATRLFGRADNFTLRVLRAGGRGWSGGGRAPTGCPWLLRRWRRGSRRRRLGHCRSCGERQGEKTSSYGLPVHVILLAETVLWSTRKR